MARKKNKRNKENIENIIANVRRYGSEQRGKAVLAERALLLNNVEMGAQIAIELSKLEGFVFPSPVLIGYEFAPPFILWLI